MDNFGVRPERLKQLTEKPVIPDLLVQKKSDATGETIEWQGASIKNVETMGEQSAAGLPEMKGVLLIDVPQTSPLGQAGMKAGDVILNCSGADIPDVLSLKKAEAANRWTGHLSLQVSRDQHMQAFELKLN